MYPESTADSPARLSLRQTGSPGMIYSARYGSPKRQLQFYRYPLAAHRSGPGLLCAAVCRYFTTWTSSCLYAVRRG
ncbi:hypothetical protein AAFF_G00125580 [Aldrovandia affinis]|uniref:Uncharacterized protein n=1 Tax=Aldrovandia affinis TaxID=143900 RepID=A0AAD7RRJ2_9TELE|nr:hypothetical protein AAFF_G00125580 [Aldrovandia affinis]